VLAVGVDIGGTKVAAGLVDERGRVLRQHWVPSPTTSPADIVAAVGAVVEELCRDDEPIVAVGVGAAGFLDLARETVRFAPNLVWRDEPLRAELTARLGRPVTIENDADAMAWAEYRFGAGRGVDVLACLTVGTGIGGGLVLHGDLFRGGFGIGAEFGHLGMVPGGRACGCGQHGCWEQYASGRALGRIARERLDAAGGGAERVLELAGGRAEDIDGVHVTDAAAEKDRFALDCLTEVGGWLGRGMASLAAVLDPQVFVVGGGVANAGELLLAPARASFAELLTGSGRRPIAELRLAELGPDAGLVGAADLARLAVPSSSR
jgi:glucokinase